MTPMRATVALLVAALGIWALLSWGGLGGSDADGDPYAESDDIDVAPGPGIEYEPTLEGTAEVVPPEEPEVERSFRFVARHGGDDRVLEGVRIDDPETGYVGTTNNEGVLELTRSLERFQFEATMRGYLLTRGTARGDAETLVFMTPGVPVTGTVLDRDSKKPIAGAAIRVWDDDAARFISGHIASDENGRFELLGVRLSHPFTLLVQVEELVPVRSRHQVFGENEDLEVLVGGGGTITGTVAGLKPDGEEPIDIYLVPRGRRVPGDERPHDPWQGPPKHTKEDLDRYRWTTYRTVTDAEGGFEMKGVPYEVPLEVVARVDAREQVRSKLVWLTAQKPKAHVELELRKRASIKIVVIDEEGATVPDARFELRGAYADFPLDKPAYVDARGSRVFDDIPEGTYGLVTEIPDGPKHYDGVTLTAEKQVEVTVETVIGLSLSGTVRGPDGELVPRARITWIPSNRELPRVQVNANRQGTYFMRGLIDRAHEVYVDPPPNATAHTRYRRNAAGRISAGQKKLVLELKGKESFEGTIFGRKPIGRVQVQVLTKRWRKTYWFKIKDDGRFTLPGLPETSGLIVFRARDFAPTFIYYLSERDANEKLARVWMDEPAKVPVTVHSGSKHVAGARIVPADQRLNLVWRTDAKGEADLDGLPIGPTRVVADSPWHKPKAVSVSAAAAGTRNHIHLAAEMGVVEGLVTLKASRSRYHVVFLSERPRRRHRAKGEVSRARLDAAGWFKARVPAGRYYVWLFRSERWPQYQLGRVRVKAGERTLFEHR